MIAQQDEKQRGEVDQEEDVLDLAKEKEQQPDESSAEVNDAAAPEDAGEDSAAADDSESPEAVVIDPVLTIARLESEVEKERSKALRAAAEVQNIRRRSAIDVEKAHKFALEGFAKALLPVADSLEKAVEVSAGDTDAMEAIRKGGEMTLQLLTDVFGKFNLVQVDPAGEPFDPQLHQAMSIVESADAEPNSVMVVVQKGYLLNERLIRPAMVIVSKEVKATKVDS